eukprot:gb/GECG01004569.1/.p1 GENE.gb/GECG01004569.1/~~gb/GECG01004569.1/.p1  ORF type:complete len:253 (+),score=29.25 gb/GECG01004569.1/:1-759(+)
MATLRNSKSDHSLVRSGSSVNLWEEEEAAENTRIVEQEPEFDRALKALSEWTLDHVKHLSKNLQSQLELAKQHHVSLTKISRAKFVDLFGKPIESIMRSDRSFMILPLSVYTLVDPEQSNRVRIGKILLAILLAGNNDYEGCEGTCFKLYGVRELNLSEERSRTLVEDVLRTAEDLQKQRDSFDDKYLNTKIEELRYASRNPPNSKCPEEVLTPFRTMVRRLRRLLHSEGSGHGTEDGSQNQVMLQLRCVRS